ncbi:hypothetical protein EI94DRAFT_1257723 [Lactarius quietus]|nr:hypothetical protein EI94DRAFT_1257723 [Lactarius quietus]
MSRGLSILLESAYSKLPNVSYIVYTAFSHPSLDRPRSSQLRFLSWLNTPAQINIPSIPSPLRRPHGMAQLSEGDIRVVRMWWQRSKKDISDNGFTLDNYHPPVKWPDHVGGRSFQVILEAVGKISAKAKSKGNSPVEVELTVWQVPPTITSATYFQVNNLGSYTVMATPINRPPRQPGCLWLRWRW